MTDNTDILNELFQHDLTPQIEGDLIAMLNEWHSLPEVWDNELDAQIHRWYSNPPKVFPKRPYFSPSSVTACPRELYLKDKRAKRDEVKRQPHQGRWTRIGTAIGDVIQRDLLFIEKHYERQTGKPPKFRLLRTKNGEPAFEDFVKINRTIEHNGETFNLYGTCDGILEYETDSGDKIRVGLEIKSKQTTPARTSLYSMKEAEESHVAQTVAYSIMYGVDYYVVLYVNAAKQSWNLTDEQATKTPDIRAFCRKIDDKERTELLDTLAEQTRRQRTGDKPPLDLSKWTFNNYKEACANDLTDDEYDEIKTTVKRVEASRLKDWQKRQYTEALAFIMEVRKGKR